MENFDQILVRYGLGKPRVEKENEVEELVKRTFLSDKGQELYAKARLENKMLNNYIGCRGGILISNKKFFKSMIKEKGISTDVDDWKLGLLYIENDSYVTRGKIVFTPMGEKRVERLISYEMKKNKHILKEEYPEFYIASVFDEKNALNELRLKVTVELEPFLDEINKLDFLTQVKKEITKGLWELFQKQKISIPNT